KKRMKQGVFARHAFVRAGCMRCTRCAKRVPGAAPDRCTAAVDATSTGHAFPAPHKPVCAKLRKLRHLPRTLVECDATQSADKSAALANANARHPDNADACNGRGIARAR